MTGRIFSSLRYLATVRRAIGIPRSLKISTISLSLNGLIAIRTLHEVEDSFFTLVLLNDSLWWLVAGAKKYFISKLPCGVAIYSPETARPDGSLTHADHVGDFCHGHRVQMRSPMLEEIVLPRNDLLRDVGNRLLALMDRANQEFPAPDSIAM